MALPHWRSLKTVNLRTRIFLIVSLALIALIGWVHVLSNTILMRGFKKVEDTYIRRNVVRAKKVLESQVSLLDTKSSDWATWDDTYEFIVDLNEKYIRSNLASLAAFYDLGVNFILYYNSKGQLVYSKGVDLEKGKAIPVPKALLDVVASDSPILKHASTDSVVSGIAMTGEVPLMLASRPITTSAREGPIRGTLIFARFLDEKMISLISEIANMKIAFFGIDPLPTELRKIGRDLERRKDVVVENEGDDTIEGYGLIRDFHGEPVMILQVTNDRAIFLQGRTTLFYLLLSTLFVGLGIGILALVLLQRLVFARLDRVEADVRAVGVNADLSARVKVEGHDELSTLAETINRTLEALESSRVQLASSERRLALVLDAMSEGVWDRSLRTGDTYYSPQWIRSLGYSPEEVGCRAGFREELVHPDDVARETLAIEEHIEKRTPSFTCEVRLRMRNGGWRWYLERGKIVEWSESGEPVRMVGTDRDITVQRRLEEQFFEVQKMDAVAKLAGGIAHDFNNLLTIIVGQSQAIRNELDGDGQMLSRTAEINNAAKKAALLTRQLLAFSRNQTLHPRVIDLRLVVDSIEDMLCRSIGEDILLKTVRTPQPAWVKADISQIEQVLLSMAVNARDAMPSGGQLIIEISDVFVSSEEPLGEELMPGNYVMIEITDTGVGMSEAVRSRIFEPFFTTKGPGKGSGLGLASCYGIVKQSGGHVTVRSEPGVGSTFSIYLPAADAPGEEIKSPKIESNDMPRGHETVIVVEDEPIVRELAVEILRSCGYEVIEAGDGLAAKKLVAAFGVERIDIVVTDVVMPNMGGKEFRDWFMKERPDARVLFISGFTSGVFSCESDEQEQFTLLEKPFTPADLARKVREVLDN